MKKRLFIYIGLIICFSGLNLFAQSTRDLVNKGVDLYKKGKMTDAEVNFKKGVEKDPKNFVTNFNLGDAYYKQKRFDEAIKSYKSALTESKTDDQKSRIYHNIGNSYLQDKKIKESIDAYKKALKLNPNDQETKYNLSYALNQMKQPQDKNKDNKDKNDKDKDKKDNKDQQNKQDQNKDKNKDNKNQQDQDKKDQKKQDQKNQKQQPKDQKNKISKADAQRILEALKNNEKDLQKKLRKKKGKATKTEKDW